MQLGVIVVPVVVPDHYSLDGAPLWALVLLWALLGVCAMLAAGLAILGLWDWWRDRRGD